jgi:large subunit ribosomal protein L22
VIDMIRGKAVDDALNILHFDPHHASKVAEMVVRSAVSNIQNKDDARKIDVDTLYIKEVFVNGGPMQKRILPAPMGRAFRIRKRSNHLTVIVAQRQGK